MTSTRVDLSLSGQNVSPTQDENGTEWEHKELIAVPSTGDDADSDDVAEIHLEGDQSRKSE